MSRPLVLLSGLLLGMTLFAIGDGLLAQAQEEVKPLSSVAPPTEVILDNKEAPGGRCRVTHVGLLEGGTAYLLELNEANVEAVLDTLDLYPAAKLEVRVYRAVTGDVERRTLKMPLAKDPAEKKLQLGRFLGRKVTVSGRKVTVEDGTGDDAKTGTLVGIAEQKLRLLVEDKIQEITLETAAYVAFDNEVFGSILIYAKTDQKIRARIRYRCDVPGWKMRYDLNRRPGNDVRGFVDGWAEVDNQTTFPWHKEHRIVLREGTDTYTLLEPQLAVREAGLIRVREVQQMPIQVEEMLLYDASWKEQVCHPKQMLRLTNSVSGAVGLTAGSWLVHCGDRVCRQGSLALPRSAPAPALPANPPGSTPGHKGQVPLDCGMHTGVQVKRSGKSDTKTCRVASMGRNEVSYYQRRTTKYEFTNESNHLQEVWFQMDSDDDWQVEAYTQPMRVPPRKKVTLEVNENQKKPQSLDLRMATLERLEGLLKTPGPTHEDGIANRLSRIADIRREITKVEQTISTAQSRILDIENQRQLLLDNDFSREQLASVHGLDDQITALRKQVRDDQKRLGELQLQLDRELTRPKTSDW